MSFPASFNLADLNGSNGFVLNGVDAGYISGGSVSNVGDFNGDGFDDILIGGNGGDLFGAVLNSESYVVFGSAEGFSSSLNLSDLNGTNGVVINKRFNDTEILSTIGYSVSGAGDINGDGLGDILISVPFRETGNSSDTGVNIYAVFGNQQGFDNSFNLSDLNGQNGSFLNIPEATASFTAPIVSASINAAGDINGDGFDDIIVGLPLADLEPANDPFYVEGDPSETGETYVIFGNAQGFSPSVEVSRSSINGSNGFVLNGIDSFDYSGQAVSSAGDFNGDGFDDILINSKGIVLDNGNRASETYLVFGSNQGFESSLDLAELDGSNGLVFQGVDATGVSNFFSAVSEAGDINGDGFDDIIIGESWATPDDNNGAGKTYVVFGSGQAFNASFDLAELEGSNGFVLNGIDPDDASGSSVSSAGDFNGDGFDDILISATGAGPNGNSRAGETYVLFGGGQGFNANIDLASLDGSNGFVLNGIDAGDSSGSSVSSAGDINSDGFDDILIGALTADPNNNDDAGETYVIFGRPNEASLLLYQPEQQLGSLGYLAGGQQPNKILDPETAPLWTGWKPVGRGDFDQDGQTDIVIQHEENDWKGILYLQGSGIQSSQSIVGWEDWDIIGTGNFDNDGAQDLLIRHQSQPWYGVLKMGGENGNEITGSQGILPWAGWEIKATGDFNNDGQADLVMQHQTENWFGLFYLDANQQIIDSQGVAGWADWDVIGASDLNNDGQTDLLIEHQSQPWDGVWYMNGNQITGSQGFSTPSGWEIVA